MAIEQFLDRVFKDPKIKYRLDLFTQEKKRLQMFERKGRVRIRCMVRDRDYVAKPEEVVRQLEGVEAVYFTLDIDGLDPAYAPGTGTPEAGGLSTRELLGLLGVVFARLPVRAMDIVEVAPPLDHADVTSFAAVRVIYEVWGWVKGKK